MSHQRNLSTNNDHEYVDIHGRDIPAVTIKETGEVAFPLLDLKQTGVAIFKKSQYAKLATINAQFDENFDTFMLESAKKYMLENKITFPENVIVNSINSCKKMLTGKKDTTPKKGFFNDRQIEELSDNEILIHVNGSPSSQVSPASSKNKIKTPKFQKTIAKNSSPETLNHKIDVKRNDKNLSKTDASQPKAPKLRPPRSKILEKIPLDENIGNEHNVIVTCIHKPNCIWVKNKANEELFTKVHYMVNQEAKYQKVVQKPWQLEKVYMAQDEGLWFRCKVMKFTPLTVFFVDYGNVAQVNEIREVSEELGKIPCMAVRLTFMESEYKPCLEDEITIKIIKQNEDTTYFVNVLKKPKKPDQVPGSFFKMPPPLASLENGQTVIVVHVENGIFYLRTKECCLKLKEIENGIEEYIKSSAQPINTIKVGQLVLVHNEDDDKYFRAVVTLIKPKKVDVKYLDYHKTAIVDRNSLKNINEPLSLEPVTYFQARKLKGFERTNFSEEEQILIEEIIKKRKKFAVVDDGLDSFDLFDRTVLLSQQLRQLKNGPKKIHLKDMKTYQPKFDTGTYLCGFYKSSEEFSLVASEALELYIDSVLITDIHDPEPYTPAVGEVCFCYYTDQWYRCLVTRTLNDDFEVILLDFGNVEVVKKEDFRQPKDEIINVPLLALPCKLINLPNHANVEDLLKKMVIEGELYNVDVKSINDGKYSVEISSVYQEISKL